MDRKIVKPAQDGGRIWSPDHRRFLPAEGLEVEMAPFWLHLAERGDIKVSDAPVAAAGAGPEPAIEAPAAPAA